MRMRNIIAVLTLLYLHLAAAQPKHPFNHTATTRKYSRSEVRIGSRNETVKEFVERLFGGYNGNIPPSTYDGTITTVQVGVYILDFGSLDLVNMDYSVTMFLRQIWHDPRLKYKDYNETLTLNYMRPKMWVPDLYFINEKQSKMHELTTPNLLMRLYPDGKIVYSQKVTVQLWCIMDLRKFPLDTQSCEMKMESYGYTTEEVKLQWVNGSGALQFAHRQLSEYELLSEHTGQCTEVYMTGSYSCLNVTFKMERKFGYYLIQTYIPTVLIVILSWVSFWIDVHAVPARISVGLLTVLSMTTQSSGMRAQLPRVSYVKAIDVWQSVSLIFVFGALIEFAIANFLQRLRDRLSNMEVLYDGEGTRRNPTAPAVYQTKSKTKKPGDKRRNKAHAMPNYCRRPSILFSLTHRSVPQAVRTCAECALVDSTSEYPWQRRLPGDIELSTNGGWQSCNCRLMLSDGNTRSAHTKANGSAKLNSHAVDLDGVSQAASSDVDECFTNAKNKNQPAEAKITIDDDSSSDVARYSLAKSMDPEKLDQAARYLFPVSFLLFNLLYWLYYLFVK